MSFFSNVQGNAYVNGGTFNHVEGNLYLYQTQDNSKSHDTEQGLQTLSKVISTGAFHDASARDPPPRCHPGTRTAVLNIITSWLEEGCHLGEPQKRMMWIRGMVGSGKTAIAQTLAELYSIPGRSAIFGGSFFFPKEGKSDREHANTLFATIAYQLALSVLGLREFVNRVMILEPTLPTKEIGVQFTKLIIEPFQRLGPLPYITFVVIDGLDECHLHDFQRRIISLIAEGLALSGVPLRFIITSRPEPHIRDTFDLAHIKPITRTVALETFNADRDIRLYLRDHFKAIAERREGDLPENWPEEADIDDLVKKASGQFIYSAVVLDFVGAEHDFPDERLQNVLQPATGALECYSPIDQLYIQILGTTPNPDILASIFSLLLVFHCPQPPEVYDELLGYRRGKVRMALKPLHSIIRVPHPTEDQHERRKFERRAEYDQTRGLRLHPASFRDFLLDESRCPSEFHVDLKAAHATLAKSGFNLMLKWICTPWSLEGRDNSPNRDTFGYLKHHMCDHLKQCQPNEYQLIMEDLHRFQIAFSPTKPLGHLCWDHSFHALHSLLTSLAKVLSDSNPGGRAQYLDPNIFHSEHSHWAQEHVWVVEISGQRSPTTPTPDKAVLKIYLKFRNILDSFYASALSSSDDMLHFLDKLPGFATQKHPAPIERLPLEDIFEDNMTSMLHNNRNFIHIWETGFGARELSSVQESREVVLLNPHFSSFLNDPQRAGKFYQDPKDRYILDLRQTIAMIMHPDWLQKSRKQKGLIYLDGVLKTCFENVSIDCPTPPQIFPTEHPILQLLDMLGGIVYDPAILGNAPITNVGVIWSMTRRLLDWLERQTIKIRSTHLDPNGFRERIINASNLIYHQILELDNGIVTIRQPFRALFTGVSHGLLPGPGISSPTASSASSIRISETLLALHGIRNSLTSFLTKRDRARELFISRVHYHTQAAEICLTYCDPSVSNIITDWRTVPAHTEWRFHLDRARPSERLLSSLRSISIGPWLAEGLPTSDRKAKIKTVQAIIAWLQNHPASVHVGSNADVLDRWQEALTTLKRFNMPKSVSRITFPSEGQSEISSHLRGATSASSF